MSPTALGRFMPRISDQEGSKFDAPIELIWKYLQDPEAHGGAHRNTRNRAMKPQAWIIR